MNSLRIVFLFYLLFFCIASSYSQSALESIRSVDIDGVLDENYTFQELHGVEYSLIQNDHSIVWAGKVKSEVPLNQNTWNTPFLAKDQIGLMISNKMLDHKYFVIIDPFGNLQLFYQSKKGESQLYEYDFCSDIHSKSSVQDSIWSFEVAIPFSCIYEIPNYTFSIQLFTYQNEREIYEVINSQQLDSMKNDQYQIESKKMNSLNLELGLSGATVYEPSFEPSEYQVFPSVDLEWNKNSRKTLLNAFSDHSDMPTIPIYTNKSPLRQYIPEHRSSYQNSTESFFETNFSRNNRLVYTPNINPNNQASVHLSHIGQVKLFQAGLQYDYFPNNHIVQAKSIFNLNAYHSLMAHLYYLPNSSLSNMTIGYQTTAVKDNKISVLVSQISPNYIGNDDLRIHLGINRSKDWGINYHLTTDYVGDDYKEFGFEDGLAPYQADAGVGFRWSRGNDSPIHEGRVRGMLMVQNNLTTLQYIQQGFSYRLTRYNGSEWNVGYMYQTHRIDEAMFVLPHIEVFKGNYGYGMFHIGAKNNPTQAFHYGLLLTVGQFYNGQFLEIDQNAVLRLGRRFSTKIRYILRLDALADFPDTDMVINHIVTNEWKYQIANRWNVALELALVNDNPSVRSMLIEYQKNKWNVYFRVFNQNPYLDTQLSQNTIYYNNQDRMMLGVKYAILPR